MNNKDNMIDRSPYRVLSTTYKIQITYLDLRYVFTTGNEIKL